jgi:flagellar biosynthesis regulator FlaF
MYQFSYAEIQSDSVADARDREKQLLTRSIDMLVEAREKGLQSREAIEALHLPQSGLDALRRGSGQSGKRAAQGACAPT